MWHLALKLAGFCTGLTPGNTEVPGVSREDPCSALKGDTVLDTLDATAKVPRHAGFPRGVVSFAVIFSHSKGCLFILLIVSFAVQKVLSLSRSHLFTFVFISITVGGGCGCGLGPSQVRLG